MPNSFEALLILFFVAPGFVASDNGDIYVGIVKSIPHDYETLHGDDKDFSLAKVNYLRSDTGILESLEDQVVLLNTSDVAAIHIIETDKIELCG